MRPVAVLCALVLSFALVPSAHAHFGLVLPSRDIVTDKDPRTITLALKFVHPMEGSYMEMGKPARFGVMNDGKKTDLLPSLLSAKGRGPGQDRDFTFWKADFAVKRPGDHVFFMEPAPYFEPAEDIFIIHYTKVVVNAFGREGGWATPVGLPAEILPLTRPYGLWTGNVFTGRVLVAGKPVPGAEVEVEYLNESPGNPSRVSPPSDPFVTQVVRADRDGVFTYAMPRAGWWGFSALSEAKKTMQKDGKPKKVEIGGVIWVNTTDMR